MIWLALLGLISIAFILAGWNLAVRRMRRHSLEAETRRLRAFAQMVEIGEKAKERKKNEEHRTQKEIITN
jgi:hypothetical protein